MAKTELEGEYYRHRWAKDDGSWMIADLKDGTCIVGAAKPEMFIRGVTYRFSGQWASHPQYGRQFKFTNFIAREPVTDASVTAYLNKYLFGKRTGIGPAKGRLLIAEFGAEKTIATIKAKPERVAEVTGVSIDAAREASALLIKVEKFEATRMQLVQLFEGRGFSQTCIESCIEAFGVTAADRIRRDPFTLLVRKFNSAGFLRCDQLYRDLGLPEHRLKRQTICLWHQINQASGSVWIDAQQAVIELKRLISSQANPRKAIILGRRANWITTRRDSQNKLWIAESQEAAHEHVIKNCLRELFHDKANKQPKRSIGSHPEFAS